MFSFSSFSIHSPLLSTKNATHLRKASELAMADYLSREAMVSRSPPYNRQLAQLWDAGNISTASTDLMSAKDVEDSQRTCPAIGDYTWKLVNNTVTRATSWTTRRKRYGKHATDSCFSQMVWYIIGTTKPDSHRIIHWERTNNCWLCYLKIYFRIILRGMKSQIHIKLRLLEDNAKVVGFKQCLSKMRSAYLHM